MRHCSICHRTGHDARRHAGRTRARRNPDSEQLGAAFSRSLEKAIAANGRRDAKAAHYWERATKRIGDVIDDPRKPYPDEFVTVRNKYGQAVVVPRRYGLESEDKYRPGEDAKHAAMAKVNRRNDRLDRREAAEADSARHERAHKRKLGYDPARAKALRERRTREVSVSPTATRKAYAAAQAKALREGKQLVVRARGGGNLAQQDYFARRTGN